MNNDVVYETRDYGRFDLCSFNRDVLRTKKLEESMREHGWISAYPMHCVRNGSNNKLHIKAGHHRFEVARRLNIPVKYVVCSDNAVIHDLEASTNRWDLLDYLTSFCRLNNEHYLKVKNYHDRTGIPLALCVSVLAGETAGSHNHDTRFKAGVYKVSGNTKNAEALADIVLYCKTKSIDFAANVRFVRAVSLLLWLPEFDAQQFKKKASSFQHIMQKQPTIDTFLQMIETVYNMQSRTKIPLFFLAKDAARRRSAAKLD